MSLFPSLSPPFRPGNWHFQKHRARSNSLQLMYGRVVHTLLQPLFLCRPGLVDPLRGIAWSMPWYRSGHGILQHPEKIIFLFFENVLFIKNQLQHLSENLLYFTRLKLQHLSKTYFFILQLCFKHYNTCPEIFFISKIFQKNVVCCNNSYIFKKCC